MRFTLKCLTAILLCILAANAQIETSNTLPDATATLVVVNLDGSGSMTDQQGEWALVQSTTREVLATLDDIPNLIIGGVVFSGNAQIIRAEDQNPILYTTDNPRDPNRVRLLSEFLQVSPTGKKTLFKPAVEASLLLFQELSGNGISKLVIVFISDFETKGTAPNQTDLNPAELGRILDITGKPDKAVSVVTIDPRKSWSSRTLVKVFAIPTGDSILPIISDTSSSDTGQVYLTAVVIAGQNIVPSVPPKYSPAETVTTRETTTAQASEESSIPVDSTAQRGHVITRDLITTTDSSAAEAAGARKNHHRTTVFLIGAGLFLFLAIASLAWRKRKKADGQIQGSLEANFWIDGQPPRYECIEINVDEAVPFGGGFEILTKNGLHIPEAAELLGTIQQSGGQLTVFPNPGIDLLMDGQPVQAGTEFPVGGVLTRDGASWAIRRIEADEITKMPMASAESASSLTT